MDGNSQASAEKARKAILKMSSESDSSAEFKMAARDLAFSFNALDAAGVFDTSGAKRYTVREDTEERMSATQTVVDFIRADETLLAAARTAAKNDRYSPFFSFKQWVTGVLRGENGGNPVAMYFGASFEDTLDVKQEVDRQGGVIAINWSELVAKIS